MLSRYLFMVGKGITFHEEQKQQTTTVATVTIVAGNQNLFSEKNTFPTTGISATMLTSVLNPPLTLHTQFGCPPNIAIDCQHSLLSDDDQQVSLFVLFILVD